MQFPYMKTTCIDEETDLNLGSEQKYFFGFYSNIIFCPFNPASPEKRI